MSARERLALDAITFVLVIAAANPAVTGISLHEWLGAVLVVPALIHLVVNWDWVAHAVTRFFGRIRTVSRINLVVDAGLFVSLVAVTVSGILVVPGLAASLGLDATPHWHVVHLTTSNLTIGFTLAHLVLHAKWVGGVVRRLVAPSAGLQPHVSAPVARASAQPATVSEPARQTFDR